MIFGRKRAEIAEMQKQIDYLEETVCYLKRMFYRLNKPPFENGTKVAVFDCKNDGHFIIGIVGGFEETKTYAYGYDYYVVIGKRVEKRSNVFLYDPKIHKVKK